MTPRFGQVLVLTLKSQQDSVDTRRCALPNLQSVENVVGKDAKHVPRDRQAKWSKSAKGHWSPGGHAGAREKMCLADRRVSAGAGACQA